MSPVQPSSSFAATCTGMTLPPEAGGTVMGLQRYLNRIGFGPLKVDGVCGFATFNAWQKWQDARLRTGWLQHTPSTPPSRPVILPAPPVMKPPELLPPPPPEEKPIWKRPGFWIAVGGVTFAGFFFFRRRRRS